MPWVGPFSMLPDLLRSMWNTGLTANTRNKTQATQTSRTHKAARPEPLLTRATQRARRIQPTTSFPTPAASVVTPTSVCRRFSSDKMRQSTGKAVMDKAVPMKRAYTPKAIGAVESTLWKALYRPQATPHPRPKGRIMPASPTLRATRQLDVNMRMSTSSAMRKRKRIRPKLAELFRTGIEAAGKMASLKPGIRDSTEGPNRMPPMTSAMTRGCPR